MNARLRLREALQRLISHERQADLDPESRLLRLLPLCKAVWYADELATMLENGVDGSLPYMPPRYREGHPFYDPALDD